MLLEDIQKQALNRSLPPLPANTLSSIPSGCVVALDEPLMREIAQQMATCVFEYNKKNLFETQAATKNMQKLLKLRTDKVLDVAERLRENPNPSNEFLLLLKRTIDARAEIIVKFFAQLGEQNSSLGINVVTAEDIYQGLVELAKDQHVAGLYFYPTAERGFLVVKTKKFEIGYDNESDEDVICGPFELQLRIAVPWDRNIFEEGIELGRCPMKRYLWVNTSNEAQISSGGHPHPHISADGGYICLGDTIESVNTFYLKGDIQTLFFFVLGVLDNYDEEAAYRSIENWLSPAEEEDNTVECSICGYNYDPEHEGSYCDHCEHDVCDEHRRSCDECRSACCSNCTVRCELCDSLICGGSRCLYYGLHCSECDVIFASRAEPREVTLNVCRTCFQSDGAAVSLDWFSEQEIPSRLDSFVCGVCREEKEREENDESSVADESTGESTTEAEGGSACESPNGESQPVCS